MLKHPKGLAPLFFIEMWERLAFYTMLNVLLLYTTDTERGGLGLSAGEGNEIYGLYLAFVYFTPFIGGMLADRVLGYRRAVLIGGILMATGLFLMGIPGYTYFVGGLVALIIGNGFFKPNISVMVGNLYQAGDPRRDAGFNIFYMGINIGALIASFLSAVVRNEYGWLWTFWAASGGLVLGLGILVVNWKNLRVADRQPEIDPEDTGMREVVIKILAPAFGVGLAAFLLANHYATGGDLHLPLFGGTTVRPAVVGFLAGMIPVIVFFVRLGTTARPEEKPGLLSLLPIYVAGGTFFMVLHLNGSAMTQWARDTTDRAIDVAWLPKQEALPSYYPNAGEEIPRPDPRSLVVVDDVKLARMYGQYKMDGASVAAVAAAASDVTVREFPADQTASGLSEPEQFVFNRATDVYADGTVTVVEGRDSHGQPEVKVSVPEGAKPIRKVAFVREIDDGKDIGAFVVERQLFESLYEGYRAKFGKEPTLLSAGEYLPVINSELYQSLNALFVIIGTPLVVLFFGWLVRRNREVSTARKVFLGMVLTTLSLLVMAGAGAMSDGGDSRVSSWWLVGFYALVTIGELCLSPMGLSLVTKLTPKRLVGLAMGGWFLATSFGNNFSGFFGGIQSQMEPTVFFLVLAGISGAVALFIFLLLPKLDAAIKKYGA